MLFSSEESFLSEKISFCFLPLPFFFAILKPTRHSEHSLAHSDNIWRHAYVIIRHAYVTEIKRSIMLHILHRFCRFWIKFGCQFKNLGLLSGIIFYSGILWSQTKKREPCPFMMWQNWHYVTTFFLLILSTFFIHALSCPFWLRHAYSWFVFLINRLKLCSGPKTHPHGRRIPVPELY